MRAVTVMVLIFFCLVPMLALAEPQEGVASYYADSLNGNLTASEEPYDKDAMTAAHRTRVKVINLDNGKHVVVIINDRGPHVQSRIIDVSGAAARELGMVDTGTAMVRIEVQE
jgi:rare lipoprotein A